MIAWSAAGTFAAKPSAAGGGCSERSATTTSISTSLRLAFVRAASTAAGWRSIATTGFHPSRAARIASTPVPQPRSANEPLGGRSSRSSRQVRVVWCVPPPNAALSESTMSITPGRGSGAQSGRTTRRPPIASCSYSARRRSRQSSATSCSESRCGQRPTARSISASSGTSGPRIRSSRCRPARCSRTPPGTIGSSRSRTSSTASRGIVSTTSRMCRARYSGAPLVGS